MATGLFYAELLDQFDAELPKKRCLLAKKTELFHTDNAGLHFRYHHGKFVTLGYKLLPHPSHSTDWHSATSLRFLT